MRYFKIIAGEIIEHTHPKMGVAWYELNGFAPYAGTLPASRLDIIAGVVVELPPVLPDEEWIDTSKFTDALLSLIPIELQAQIISSPAAFAFSVQVPSEQINILDPRVSDFLTLAGLSVAALRAEVETLNV